MGIGRATYQLQLIPARKRKKHGSKGCRSKTSPWNQQGGAGKGNTNSLSSTFHLDDVELRSTGRSERNNGSRSDRLIICWEIANKEKPYN
jgi:hypothetical protein